MAYFPFDPMAARIPILKRVVPSILKRWGHLTWTGGFRVVRAHGAYFLVRYSDFVDRQIAFYGDYEPRERKFFEKAFGSFRPTAFLDIGANLGYYTVLAATRWNIKRVIALEPEPEIFGHLCANLFLNHLMGRVEALNIAASDSAALLNFQSTAGAYSGLSHVSYNGEGNMRVRAERVDALVELKGERLAVKIDVEGHELAALVGMERTLSENACFLMVESLPDKRPRVDEWLATRGFSESQPMAHNKFYWRPPAQAGA